MIHISLTCKIPSSSPIPLRVLSLCSTSPKSRILSSKLSPGIKPGDFSGVDPEVQLLKFSTLDQQTEIKELPVLSTPTHMHAHT